MESARSRAHKILNIYLLKKIMSLFADNETEDDRNKFELFMYVWIEYSKETSKMGQRNYILNMWRSQQRYND